MNVCKRFYVYMVESCTNWKNSLRKLATKID